MATEETKYWVHSRLPFWLLSGRISTPRVLFAKRAEWIFLQPFFYALAMEIVLTCKL